MIFVLAMIQRGAITYPFWDEFELRTYFFNYYHGTLRLLDFFNSHAHTRPAVVFGVYFLNGLLTGWDVRSEFVIHTASICLGFLRRAGFCSTRCGGDFPSCSLPPCCWSRSWSFRRSDITTIGGPSAANTRSPACSSPWRWARWRFSAGDGPDNSAP